MRLLPGGGEVLRAGGRSRRGAVRVRLPNNLHCAKEKEKDINDRPQRAPHKGTHASICLLPDELVFEPSVRRDADGDCPHRVRRRG